MAIGGLDAYNPASTIPLRVNSKLMIQKFAVIFCSVLALPALGREDGVEAGPLYSEFPLTLSSGYRCEAAGPLYYSQQTESQRQWGLPPLYCYTRTPDVDWTEM